MCLKADQLGHGCVCYTDGRVCCNGGCLIETAGFVTEAAASGDRRGGGEGVAVQAAGLWWNSHGIPSGDGKGRAFGRGLFCFSSPIFTIPSPDGKDAKIQESSAILIASGNRRCFAVPQSYSTA
jgi:hypothetical protein